MACRATTYACRPIILTLSRLLARKTNMLALDQPLPSSNQRSPGSTRWFHDQAHSICRTGSGVRKVRLLVDGDSFGGAQVRDAMKHLAEKFIDVNTLIFAAPGLIKTKKMSRLVDQSNISFVPVPRGQDLAAEPNDNAIISEMQKCAKNPGDECIALLTGDKGFANVIKLLMSNRQEILVVVPANCFNAIRCFQEHGIPMLSLPVEEQICKVRAILDAHGNGTVEIGNDIDLSAYQAQCEGMYESWEKLLKSQGCSASFVSSGAYKIQRIAKFWFSNGLGSVPVYPVSLAVSALDNAIRHQPQRWILNSNALACVLPITSPGGRLNKSELKTYGSQLGRQVFRGGGPFMLRDSHEFTVEALRKLGYLDDLWNTDLREALSCFWNTKTNKYKLRKLGMMVDSFETTSDAAAKLRAALLSDNTDAQWQRGGTCTPAVIDRLRSKKILSRCSESPAMDEVWCAMKTYAKVHGLLSMKTFNALAASIVQHATQNDPRRRGRISIDD